jgi:hypothetical protein
MKVEYYRYDENYNPVPVMESLDFSKWITDGGLVNYYKWLDKGHMIMKQTTLPDGTFVSTIFLGRDHSWGEDKPLLWETMVFKKNGDDSDLERDYTRNEALATHELLVKKYS